MASLFIDFNIKSSDNARELTFTEETGAYNSSTNAGGWGSPNPATSAALTATLTITDTDDVSTVINLFDDGFPTTDRTKEVQIRTQDIGGGTDDQFTDGTYTVTYTVTTATNTYTNTQTICLSGQARCCVFGLLSEADVTECDCDNSDLARCLEAYTYYRVAVANAACGNSDRFEDTLKIIEKYCDSDCNCGCD